MVEIDEDSDWSYEVNLINKIVCDSMQVLTGNIPISCEYCLSEVWSKQAKAVYDSNGNISVWRLPDEDQITSTAERDNSEQELDSDDADFDDDV